MGLYGKNDGFDDIRLRSAPKQRNEPVVVVQFKQYKDDISLSLGGVGTMLPVPSSELPENVVSAWEAEAQGWNFGLLKMSNGRFRSAAEHEEKNVIVPLPRTVAVRLARLAGIEELK